MHFFFFFFLLPSSYSLKPLSSSTFTSLSRLRLLSSRLLLTSSSSSVDLLNTATFPPLETDYLGLINFCLRSSDNALSRSSRSKILNTLTNDIFKAIMINNDKIVSSTLSRFEAYSELIDRAECILSAEEDGDAISTAEGASIACTRDALTARIYIDWCENLLSKGTTQDNVVLGGISMMRIYLFMSLRSIPLSLKKQLYLYFIRYL